jgi:hypothetical protein
LEEGFEVAGSGWWCFGDCRDYLANSSMTAAARLTVGEIGGDSMPIKPDGGLCPPSCRAAL